LIDIDDVDFQRQTTSEKDIVEGGIAEVAPDLYEIHLFSTAWPYQGIVVRRPSKRSVKEVISGACVIFRPH
jgi:hypothetical protein